MLWCLMSNGDRWNEFRSMWGSSWWWWIEPAPNNSCESGRGNDGGGLPAALASFCGGSAAQQAARAGGSGTWRRGKGGSDALRRRLSLRGSANSAALVADEQTGMGRQTAREETASVGRPSRAIESATGSSTMAPVRGLARWAARASASARAFRPLARLKSREAGAGANKNTRQTGIGRGRPCPAALLPVHARRTRVSVNVRGNERKKKELLSSCS